MNNNPVHIIATNEFELKLQKNGNNMTMKLKQNSNKPAKQFESTFSFLHLPKQIKQKFVTMDNFYMYICDKNNIGPNTVTGIIEIRLLMKLSNGTVISTTRLGQIKLDEVVSIRDPHQIIKICKDSEKLTQQKVKLILCGIAENLVKYQSKFGVQQNSLKTGQKTIDKALEKSILDCKQRINAIISNLHHQQTQIATFKSAQQFTQKLIRQQPRNVGAPINLARQIGPIVDQKIAEMKKKITEQFNYTNGLLNTQITKLQSQIGKLKLNQSPSNAFQIHSGTTSTTTNSGQTNVTPAPKTVQSPPPAPLNPKGSADSSIANLDQIQQLIKVRTNKKMKKMTKGACMQKINKRDNFMSYFQFVDEGSIKYINKQNKRVMLFWQENILSNNMFSFKITNSKEKCIGIGIADASYYKDSICKVPVDTRPNIVYYETHTGKIFEGPNFVGKQNTGISQGQLAMVYVNLELGLIAWVASGQIRANYITPKIPDYSIEWVPMIIFNHCDDMIQLFEEDK